MGEYIKGSSASKGILSKRCVTLKPEVLIAVSTLSK